MDASMRCLLPWALLLATACHRGPPPVDPDLVPVATIPAEPMVEPDEQIGPPDAPGVDLIGKDPPSATGKTEHIAIEDEPTQSATVTASPRRDKLPSMLPGILGGPNK